MNPTKLTARFSLALFFFCIFGQTFSQVQFNLGTTNGVTYSPNVTLPATYTNAALVPSKIPCAAANYDVFNTVAAYIRTNASSLITKYGSIIINIPSGTFYINGQTLANKYAPSIQALNLNGCKNVTIKGAGITSTKISYTSGQKYGRFDSTYSTPSTNITDPTTKICYPNEFISLYIYQGGGPTLPTQNITIQDFELDGQCNTFTMGGMVSYLGTTPVYGLAAGGIVMWDKCSNINISNVYVHHMGLDGVTINSDTTTHNITIANSKFEYNGRQGLSWSGGSGVSISNSQFNYTGMGGLFDPPGAGIDIEPDFAGVAYGSTNGNFSNVSCVGNYSLALCGLWTPLITDNINFTNCTFQARQLNAVQTGGSNYKFSNCTISGNYTGVYTATNSSDATKFISCNFDDNIPGVDTIPSAMIYLNSAATRTFFDSCNFTLNKINSAFLNIDPTSSNNVTDFNTFSNCVFTHTSSQKNVNPGSDGLSYINRVIFDGNTNFINSSTQSKGFRWSNIYITGSPTPCAPYNFNIGQNLSWFFNPFVSTSEQILNFGYNTSTSANDLNLNVNNYGEMYIDGTTYNGSLTDNQYQQLSIGTNTIFSNYPNSSFFLGWDRISGTSNCRAVLNLDGKLTTSAPATISFNSSKIKTASTATNELYIHKNASLNSFGANFAGSGVCIDGGNTTSASSGMCVSPTNDALYFDGVDDYVNISTSSNKLTTSPTDFTFQIYFRRASIPGPTAQSYSALFSRRIGDTSGIELGVTKDGKIYIMYNSGRWTIADSFINVNDLQCHTITYKRATLAPTSPISYFWDYLYFDGKPTSRYMSILDVSQYNYTNSSPFYIGKSTKPIVVGSFYNADPFNGWIGQVRIWNRYLSDDEICYNYQRKKPSSNSGLLADWDMTDASGSTTLTDAVISPAQVNGTLGSSTAAPTWVSQASIGDCTNSPQINFRPTNESVITEPLLYNDEILISPNPNTGNMNIDIQGVTSDKVGITMFDINGKKVYSSSTVKGAGSQFNKILNVPNLAKGIYMLKIDFNNKVQTKKIMIE